MINLGRLFEKRDEKPIIHDDSRLVIPSGIFLLHDGNVGFLSGAMMAGAKVIICSSKNKKFVDDAGIKYKIFQNAFETVEIMPEEIVLIEVLDEDFEISSILKTYYNVNLPFIGITGTNGKTSTTGFARQLLTISGIKCLSVESGNIVVGDEVNIQFGHGLTTPSLCDMHKVHYIAQKKYQAKFVLGEVSSHGIDQGRINGLNVKVAAFTNLSQDHLDYHKDMGTYFNVKKRLFSEYLSADGCGVVNADVPEFDELSLILKERGIKMLSYGVKGEDLKLLSVRSKRSSQEIDIEYNGEKIVLKVNFVGRFQSENLLCAMLICVGLGLKMEDLVKMVDRLRAPDGRMQNILLPNGNPSNVYVDYGHTPDAIECVLKEWKETFGDKGRIIFLFGCGGDRDRGKRAIMGRIASELADIVILTDDNARSEDPVQIRKEVMSGISEDLKHKVEEIPQGRVAAIFRAIDLARENDVVILSGRGVEAYQNIGGTKIPLQDTKVAEEVLAKKWSADKSVF